MNEPCIENNWQNASRPFRFQAQRLEAFAGLSLLLDAYALVDMGVSQTLLRDGRTPICHKGCATCCTQPIPVTPLEVLGVHLYARNGVTLSLRRKLQQQFRAYDGLKSLHTPCPFALDGVCTVYPLRPIACRQFLVFETPCAPDEDTMATRPNQVFKPQYAFMHTALRHTLPWYNQQDLCPIDLNPQQQQTFFASITTIIQAIPWNKYSLSTPKVHRIAE